MDLFLGKFVIRFSKRELFEFSGRDFLQTERGHFWDRFQGFAIVEGVIDEFA